MKNGKLEVTLNIVDFDTVIAILKEVAEYKNLGEDDLSKRQYRCVTDMVKRFEEMKKEMWEDYWKVSQKTEKPLIFREDVSRDEVM